MEKQFRKRNAILACLRGSGQHPSAETVFAQLKPEYPDLSLGTVYRNLTLFKRQSLITSVGIVNGIERFDGDTTPHGHFVCTACSQVWDLPGLQPPEALWQQAQQDVDGCIDGCQMTFIGLCRACLLAEKKRRERA